MISNPIFKLNNSGLIIPGPWYSLNYDTNNSGSVTSIASIGKQGDTTILSALPNKGYKLSAFDCDYGTITDNNVYHFTNRDATISAYFEEAPVPIYPTVLMPDGHEWTTTDLDVDDGASGIFKFVNIPVGYQGETISSHYYYYWDAAMRVASNIEGYHLPTIAEWENLYNSISNDRSEVAEKLRSTATWPWSPGVDSYGFTCIGAGNMNQEYVSDTYYSSLETIGSRNCYWCYDTKSLNDRHDCAEITEHQASTRDEYSYPLYNFAFSIRLVKDY